VGLPIEKIPSDLLEKTVEEIIQAHIAEFDYPICFGFPVSHDTENYALKVGASFELSVASKLSRLKELG
jgi:muramoyltetrapeptide carboxypeptidase